MEINAVSHFFDWGIATLGMLFLLGFVGCLWQLLRMEKEGKLRWVLIAVSIMYFLLLALVVLAIFWDYFHFQECHFKMPLPPY